MGNKYVHRLVDYQHKTMSARHRRPRLQRFLLCSPRTCHKCGTTCNAASCSALFPIGLLQPRSQGWKSERMRIHTLHAYACLQLCLTNMPHPLQEPTRESVSKISSCANARESRGLARCYAWGVQRRARREYCWERGEEFWLLLRYSAKHCEL
jgi:hypothetical protein